MLDKIESKLNYMNERFGISESNPHVTKTDNLTGAYKDHVVKELHNESIEATVELTKTLRGLTDVVKDNKQSPIINPPQKSYPGITPPDKFLGPNTGPKGWL